LPGDEVIQDMADDRDPAYLKPYLRAARNHGGGFGSLLWASARTQATRFDAIRRIHDLKGRSILDVGCGRADLLDFLLKKGVRPADYVGIEAVEPLAEAAEEKAKYAAIPARIFRGDFVTEPIRMFVGADVVIFSGSLNTTDDEAFYATLRRAYEAAAEALVFNYLPADTLAGRNYLKWRPASAVIRFARTLGGKVSCLDDYLDGDSTMAVRKPDGV
jgi:SAM-dependent methyltransferase